MSLEWDISRTVISPCNKHNPSTELWSGWNQKFHFNYEPSMRFQFLFLVLTSFFFFIPSLSSPSDVLSIQKLIADFFISQDAKNFNAWDAIFTPTATYDPGSGVVTGLPAIKKKLASIVGNNVTQSSVTTQSISLFPPFDSQRSASRASATTYVIVTFLGQGANAGKAFIFYSLAKDKLVKTGDVADYGGWRISDRVFQVLVSTFLFSSFLYEAFTWHPP